MDFKIIKKTKNPFLNREEIIIEISSHTAPSFEDVRGFLGKHELVVVKKINSNFGRYKFFADVLIYSSVEDKEKTEKVPRKTKQKALEAEKQGKIEEKKKEVEQPEAPVEERAKSEKGEKPSAEEKKPVEEKPAEKSKEEIKEDKKQEAQ